MGTIPFFLDGCIDAYAGSSHALVPVQILCCIIGHELLVIRVGACIRINGN